MSLTDLQHLLLHSINIRTRYLICIKAFFYYFFIYLSGIFLWIVISSLRANIPKICWSVYSSKTTFSSLKT